MESRSRAAPTVSVLYRFGGFRRQERGQDAVEAGVGPLDKVVALLVELVDGVFAVRDDLGADVLSPGAVLDMPEQEVGPVLTGHQFAKTGDSGQIARLALVHGLAVMPIGDGTQLVRDSLAQGAP